MMRAALFLVALMLTGCGSQTDVRTGTKAQARTVTKEVIRKTPLEGGGEVIERTLISDVESVEDTAERSVTGASADTSALANGLGKIAGAAVNAATGGTGGGLVETLVVAGVTLLMGTIGGAKHAQAKQLREERDTHKADAKEGWEKYQHAVEGGKL